MRPTRSDRSVADQHAACAACGGPTSTTIGQQASGLGPGTPRQVCQRALHAPNLPAGLCYPCGAPTPRGEAFAAEWEASERYDLARQALLVACHSDDPTRIVAAGQQRRMARLDWLAAQGLLFAVERDLAGAA